jgi:hypothetical protein
MSAFVLNHQLSTDYQPANRTRVQLKNNMNSKQFLALVALMGGEASAFWRMECRGTTAQARLDPLVDYGKPGAHVHQVFGSGGEISSPMS